MYLQIETDAMRAHKKEQAGRARNLACANVPVVPLVVSCLIVVAQANAQRVQPSGPVEHPAFFDETSINAKGSSALSGINFTGSAQVAEVNQFESSSAGGEILPEAPSAIMQERPLRAAKVDEVDEDEIAHSGQPRVAPIHTKYMPAGWVAQPLTPRDKAILGARNLYSPFSMAGYVLSAGYSHLVNGQPNYGTNSHAFAKRLGAAVVRDTTEGAFTDMVFAPLLHEDPRYYVEGHRHGYAHRVLYAMTRPLITRTDSGHETLNGALLIGQASASALSYTYYPRINQNFHDTAATFGGSLAGSAIDDVVSEFSGQFLKELHLRKSAAMPR